MSLNSRHARSKSPRRGKDPARPNDVVCKAGDSLAETRLTRLWDQKFSLKAPHGSIVLLGGSELQGVAFKVLEVERVHYFTQVRTEILSLEGWVRVWSRYDDFELPTGKQLASMRDEGAHKTEAKYVF